MRAMKLRVSIQQIESKRSPAHVAQAVEHFLGKEKVPGSNPGVGSTSSAEANPATPSLTVGLLIAAAQRGRLPLWCPTPGTQRAETSTLPIKSWAMDQ